MAALQADPNLAGEANAARLQALINQAQEQEYGSKAFNIDDFEALLSRLEGSKTRQQRQKSVEGRRDIFSQGLAGMMSNF